MISSGLAMLILGILGAVTGVGMSIYNNNEARKREEEARQQNFELNELSAERADERTRALYEDLQSPSALRQQYEQAGLSPSIMFGGSGIGGNLSQGAQGEGASGVSPNVFGADANTMLGAANIAVQQAQARKLNAEADDLEGKTTESQARIQKLIAEAGNIEMDTAYKELQNTWQQFENAIKGATTTNEIAISDEQLKQATTMTEKLIAETTKAQVEGEITKATKNEVIQQIKDKTLQQQAEIMLIKGQTALNAANVKLSQAHAKSLLEHIFIDQKIANVKGQEVEIERDKLEKTVAQWAIENNFREKDQKIAIARCVVEGIAGAGVAAGSIIKAVTPLGALTKVVGL